MSHTAVHPPISPDMNQFHSRFTFRGRIIFDSAHRIGAERSLAVDAPDLPVLRTVDGRPYIPGASFKGAWRSYTEAVLRTVQAQPGSATNLSCLSIGKPDKLDADNPEKGRCLTQNEVRDLKEWYRRPENRTQLAELDEKLRQGSCWVCRVFGNGWLAAKLLIKDLMIDETTFLRTEVRDGVAIDRDTMRAADGFKYRFETVPVGAAFGLEIVVENASEAELGLVMVGLKAFEAGDILLGGAKSRGLGWCHLEPQWTQSQYVSAQNLLTHLLGERRAAYLSDAAAADQTQKWLHAFRTAIAKGD